MAGKLNGDAWRRLNAVADAMDAAIGTLCERMHMTGQAATSWRRRGEAPEVVALAAEMLLVRDRAQMSDHPVMVKSAMCLPSRPARRAVLTAEERRQRDAALVDLVRVVRQDLARGEPIARVAHARSISEARVARIAQHMGGIA